MVNNQPEKEDALKSLEEKVSELEKENITLTAGLHIQEYKASEWERYYNELLESRVFTSERLIKERNDLREKVEALEKENKDLKSNQNQQ